MAKKAAKKAAKIVSHHHPFLLQHGLIAAAAAAPAGPPAPPPPNFDCSAAGINQLKAATRIVDNGVTKINKAGHIKRVRFLLFCETNGGYDLLAINDPTLPFPAILDANKRQSLRNITNGAYYNDVNCQVSLAALGAATTPIKFIDAVFGAIPPGHRA